MVARQARIGLSLWVFVVGVVGVMFATPAWGVCSVGHPEAVVNCWRQALEGRNAEGLRDLLAEDFVSVNLSSPESASFDRDSYVAAFGDVLGSGGASGHLGDTFCLSDGDEPHTWRINDLELLLTVQYTPEGGKEQIMRQVHHRLTWTVRQVDTPEPHYVILREEIRPWE
jgi:hypothetical protein